MALMQSGEDGHVQTDDLPRVIHPTSISNDQLWRPSRLAKGCWACILRPGGGGSGAAEGGSLLQSLRRGDAHWWVSSILTCYLMRRGRGERGGRWGGSGGFRNVDAFLAMCMDVDLDMSGVGAERWGYPTTFFFLFSLF